jgi:dolichol kinase
MEFEYRRQLMHMGLGICVLLLYRFTQLSPLIIAAAGLGSFLIFQLNKRWRLGALNWLVVSFERPNLRERAPGLGFALFLSGCGIALLCFPKASAFAGIAVLTFGDASSNIFGRAFGRVKHPKWISRQKTLEGSLVGFLAGVLGAGIFVGPASAVAASFVGMVFEAMELHWDFFRLEDNLIIPVVAALAAAII